MQTVWTRLIVPFLFRKCFYPKWLAN